MFETIVGIMVYSLMIVVILGPISLLTIRLFRVLTERISIKRSIFVLLMPLSIGYYLTYKDNDKLIDRIYQTIIIAYFILAFIGSLFLLYIKTGSSFL